MVGHAEDVKTFSIIVTVTLIGGPIAKVNFMVRGVGNGTVRDFDGIYQIDAQSMDALLFSYLGYRTQEMTVNDKLP